MALMPEFEPGPHWGEASALTNVPPFAPQTYFFDPWGFHRNVFHQNET